jgi:PAS domain-containing protein
MELQQNALYRMLLDAIPIPVFVMDDDVRIMDLNEVALKLCATEKAALLQQRGGDALHCLHSKDVQEGCGRAPACRQCVIRNSVTKCLQGQTVSRARMKMEFLPAPEQKRAELLITASPLPGAEKRALLIVEDITETSTLRDIIPICMKCKKIRSDEQYWQNVDRYFHEHIGVDFSHGICPACSGEFYPELRSKRTQ